MWSVLLYTPSPAKSSNQNVSMSLQRISDRIDQLQLQRAELKFIWKVHEDWNPWYESDWTRERSITNSQQDQTSAFISANYRFIKSERFMSLKSISTQIRVMKFRLNVVRLFHCEQKSHRFDQVCTFSDKTGVLNQNRIFFPAWLWCFCALTSEMWSLNLKYVRMFKFITGHNLSHNETWTPFAGQFYLL